MTFPPCARDSSRPSASAATISGGLTSPSSGASAKSVWAADRGDIGREQFGYGLKNHLLPKTNDILRRIWIAEGFDPDAGWQEGMGGAKLDDIAAATIGARKIGNGADAPKWFQVGQWARVTNYCCDDVAIERDLVDFVDRYGYVIKSGRKLELK